MIYFQLRDLEKRKKDYDLSCLTGGLDIEDISSATAYKALRPPISSNSKVFLTEKFEGIDRKGN